MAQVKQLLLLLLVSSLWVLNCTKYNKGEGQPQAPLTLSLVWSLTRESQDENRRLLQYTSFPLWFSEMQSNVMLKEDLGTTSGKLRDHFR